MKLYDNLHYLNNFALSVTFLISKRSWFYIAFSLSDTIVVIFTLTLFYDEPIFSWTMDYETNQKLVECVQLERLTPPFKITFFGIINYFKASNSSKSHLNGSSTQ